MLVYVVAVCWRTLTPVHKENKVYNIMKSKVNKLKENYTTLKSKHFYRTNTVRVGRRPTCTLLCFETTCIDLLQLLAYVIIPYAYGRTLLRSINTQLNATIRTSMQAYMHAYIHRQKRRVCRWSSQSGCMSLIMAVVLVVHPSIRSSKLSLSSPALSHSLNLSASKLIPSHPPFIIQSDIHLNIHHPAFHQFVFPCIHPSIHPFVFVVRS